MKIVLGSIQCEGNSLSPILTRFEDFDYAKGEAMLEKINVADYFKNEGFEIVPTIYAHALPGGPVKYDDFLRLSDEIVSAIPDDVDGVWLYLHGAMCVETIGSGDTYLVSKVRKKVGDNIPISLALDFHADNTDEIVSAANCFHAFRTAPHTDHLDTELRAAKALVTMLKKGILPKPQVARANVVIPGDAVQTSLSPLREIMEMADEMEKTTPGILSVQVFNGQPWIDEPYMGPNFVVTHESDTALAKELAEKLARKFYDVRHDFKFLIEALEPDEAIKCAMESNVQVFLSDSGDNTTAGAVGDNAFMLNKLISAGAKNVLVAGIADSAACDACYNAKIGDTLTLKVGGSLSKKSESATITGKLIHTGDVVSYSGMSGGKSATLCCDGITVVITKNRTSASSTEFFESINLDYTKFDIIVVKLGYLFPALAKVAKRAILVFTPGASTERLEDMNMKNIRRPMFPLDDNFLD